MAKPMTVAEHAEWSRQIRESVRRQCRDKKLRSKRTTKGWLIDPKEASFGKEKE